MKRQADKNSLNVLSKRADVDIWIPSHPPMIAILNKEFSFFPTENWSGFNKIAWWNSLEGRSDEKLFTSQERESKEKIINKFREEFSKKPEKSKNEESNYLDQKRNNLRKHRMNLKSLHELKLLR